MTFADAFGDSGGGNFPSPFDGGDGGSSSFGDQIYEMRRRLHLIDQGTRIAGSTQIDPNFAYQLAQQPIPDDELVQQTVDGMSMGQVEEMKLFYEDLPRDVAIGHWRSLTVPVQQALIDAGVRNPMAIAKQLEPGFELSLGSLVETAADFTGEIADRSGVFGDAVGQGLHYLNVVGDTFQHAWRASSDNENVQEFSREQLLDADLRHRIETQTGQEFTDEEWRIASRPFWAQEAADVQSSGSVAAFQQETFVDGVTGVYQADPNIEQLIIDTGNEMKDSDQYGSGFRHMWDRTATGEDYIEPKVQLQVLEELDNDWASLDLAVRYVQEGADISKLINPDLVPGTPEYSEAWLRTAEQVSSDRMQAAVTELSGGKVSVGRSVASFVGINETAPGDIDSWYGALSGFIDGGVMIFADPTLLSGKIRSGYRTASLTLDSVDDAARMTDVVRAEALRRGWAEAGDVTFSNPEMADRLVRLRRSANPATAAWWRGQSRIARRNWRGADSIAGFMRALDEGNLDDYGMAFFARNPGISHGFDSLVGQHKRLRAAGEAGLTTPDEVLRYLSSQQGFAAMAEGRLGRWTHSGLELPQQTLLQSRGLTVRNGARRTLDEIHDAHVARHTDDLGLRADGRTSREVMEDLGGVSPGFLTRAARVGVATPVFGKVLTGTQRSIDAVGTHLPFQKGFRLAGPGTVTELRKLFMLSRFGEMSTKEADRLFMEFLGSMTGADDLSTMRDLLRRSGFDEDDVTSLLRQAEGTSVNDTLTRLVGEATSVTDRKNLERLRGLALGGGGMNVEGRRRVIATFFDDVFRDAGVYKTDEGQRWAERWIGNVEGQRYGVAGMDTVVINGKDTPVGILPRADWSDTSAQIDFAGFLRHTQQEHAARRLWRLGHNPATDGIMKYWKPAVLLRIGFIPRAAGEELLSFVLRDGVVNYVRMQKALTAVRPDEDLFLPLRPVVAAMSVPGRTYRRLTGRTVQERRRMMEEATRGLRGLDEGYELRQAMSELQDLEALVDISADIRSSVGRSWYNSARMADLRQRVYRDGTNSYVKTWTNKATREMRIAEMGAVELLGHYMAGEATRFMRGAARWRMSDDLLTSAREMLYDRNVSKAWTEMIASNGMLLSFADTRGAESTTINLLADGSGRPVINLRLRTPPGGSKFDEITVNGTDLGANLHNSFRFKNELERVHRDKVVSHYMIPEMRGYLSPDQMRRLATMINGTGFRARPRDLLRTPPETQAKVLDDLGYLADDMRPLYTADGQLADWFVEGYEDLVNRARLGVSAGDDGARKAQSRLALMRSEVNARQGLFDHHLVGEVDDDKIQSLVAELLRRTTDEKDRQILYRVARRFKSATGENTWGTVPPRAQLVDNMPAAAAEGAAEGRGLVEEINARPATVGVETAGEFTARMAPPDTGDYVYRVVSEEDWQRIQAEGQLTSDTRFSEVAEKDQIDVALTPHLGFGTNGNGNRLLRIRVNADELIDSEVDEAYKLLNGPVLLDQIAPSPPFVLESVPPDSMIPDTDMVRILPEGTPQPTSGAPGAVAGFDPTELANADLQADAVLERLRAAIREDGGEYAVRDIEMVAEYDDELRTLFNAWKRDSDEEFIVSAQRGETVDLASAGAINQRLNELLADHNRVVGTDRGEIAQAFEEKVRRGFRRQAEEGHTWTPELPEGTDVVLQRMKAELDLLDLDLVEPSRELAEQWDGIVEWMLRQPDSDEIYGAKVHLARLEDTIIDLRDDLGLPEAPRLRSISNVSDDEAAFLAERQLDEAADYHSSQEEPTPAAPSNRTIGPDGRSLVPREPGPTALDDDPMQAAFPAEPIDATLDPALGEALGVTSRLGRSTGGIPDSMEEAYLIENLDLEFQRIADRLLPGWDNEATDVSNYFRNRSDEVTPGPALVNDVDPSSYLEAIERIRKYINALPKRAREKVKRYALGDNEVPLAMQTRESMRDEIDSILNDIGEHHIDLTDIMDEAATFPTDSTVAELMYLFRDLDPSTRYLLADDTIPVWTGTADDLRARVTAAARRGIYDPDVLPYSREMARMTTTRDGSRVAQPLPPGHRRIVTVMGDRELLTALRTAAGDRDAIFRRLRQKGLLDTETEGFLNSFLDNLLDDDVAVGFARGNSQVGDSPISALSTVGSDDYTMMARINDMLDEIVDTSTLPSGPRLKHLGHVDVSDQSVGNFVLTWQLEDLGNGGVRISDPLIGNSRHYSTSSGRVDFNGTRMDGVDPDVPVDDWAEVLTDFVFRMFGRDEAAPSINHHLMEPLSQNNLTLEAIRNTDGELLPTSFVAPRLVEDDTKVLDALIRRGFDNVISPAIDAIVRQPMYLSAFHKQRQMWQPIAAKFRDESLDQAARVLAEDFPRTRNIDDLKAVLHDVPAEIWDNGITNLSRPGIVKRLRDADDPTLDIAADMFDTMGDDAFEVIKKWARQEESISHWVRMKAAQGAVDDVVPFIDDTSIRSYFQEYVKNLMPFYFAQEQFVRRWARTIAQTPESIRKAQMMYQGIEHMGFVQTDEFGNDYFVYPMPDAMSQWLAEAPVLEHMFGGGGRIPNVLEFTGQTAFALPGLDDPFGIPSLGPLGAIPMGMLANHFPELEPLENALLSERGVDRDLAEQLVPSWALQSYRAIIHDPKFEEQLNSTTIRAMTALEVQGSQLRLDAEEAEEAGDFERAEELQAEAARYSLRQGAEGREVEEWIDNVKSYARRMLFFKGIFASVAPASPQLTDTATLRPEFQEMLQNLPFEEAVELFMAQNPDALPFTISSTDNPSMAQVPATAATDEWLNEHGDLVDRYPVAGPWLIPTSDASGTFHRKAWTDMQAAGIRTRKTPEQWYADLKFAAGAGIYFESLENYERAMLQAGDDTALRQQIQLGWDTFRTGYLTQHPLFAEQLNGESQSEKQRVFDELSLALRDPDVPETPQTQAMRQMVISYESFAATLGQYTGDQRAEAEQIRANLRHGLYVWAQQYMLEHPEVSNLWRSVIEPLAGLRGYGAEIAITGTHAQAEGIADVGAIGAGEPLAPTGEPLAL